MSAIAKPKARCKPKQTTTPPTKTLNLSWLVNRRLPPPESLPENPVLALRRKS